jgi:hypothetical protein
MASSGTLHRVALVRTEVSDERSSSIIRVTLMIEALSSSETSVLTRARRRNIAEDAILHTHRRDNLKSYYRPYVFFMLLTTFLVFIYLLSINQ